jgi:hypothetical protein
MASYFEAKAEIRWGRRSGEDDLQQGCIKCDVIFERALGPAIDGGQGEYMIIALDSNQETIDTDNKHYASFGAAIANSS